MMSKYIDRAKVVQMLRDKAKQWFALSESPADQADGFGICYERAADLVETFNDPEAPPVVSNSLLKGELYIPETVRYEAEPLPCIFCEGKGEYEGMYCTLPCFKCNGTGTI
jgi:hypothetical protein